MSTIILTCSQCDDGEYLRGSAAGPFAECSNDDCHHYVERDDIARHLDGGETLAFVVTGPGRRRLAVVTSVGDPS